MLFLFGCFLDLFFALCFQKVDYDVSWCEFLHVYPDGVCFADLIKVRIVT